MAKKPKKKDTTMNEIAEVLIDPAAVQGSGQGAQSRGTRYRTANGTKINRENLSFQEWTEKYHQ